MGKPRRSAALGVATAVVLLDRTSKALVEQFFAAWRTRHPGEPPSVPWLGDAVRLTYAPNRGMIFGLLARTELPHRDLVLTLGTVVALGFLAAFFARIPAGRLLLLFGTALILGGAVGNLVDRVLVGHVIDFIDVSLVVTRWYVFNLADAAITCGIGLLALDAVRHRSGRSHPAGEAGGGPGRRRPPSPTPPA